MDFEKQKKEAFDRATFEVGQSVATLLKILSASK